MICNKAIALLFRRDFNFLTKLKYVEYKLFGKYCTPFCYNTPSIVAIEITSKCNFGCVWCLKRTIKYPPKDMNKEHVMSLVSQFKGVEQLFLFGLGEPLLYPIDDLVEIINYSKKYVPFVSFVTNGSKLSKEISQKLSSSKLSQLRVSIDSPDPKIYKEIRRYDLSKIKENLKRFSKISHMPLRLQAVASNKNIDSLEFMPEFCVSVGAKILSIQCLLESEASRSNNIISAESAETKKLLDKIEKKCNKMQIEFKNVNIIEADVSTHYCFDPFYKAFINVNGYITPCASFVKEELNKSDNFYSMWNSVEAKNFRKRIITKQYPDFCKGLCNKK
ncbi:MAG: radical SAM protein [Candidatus Aenigmarchaeota archaeon]|nr:radical SAM protein [Candidatus Aenigmarchaeota archaeon]